MSTRPTPGGDVDVWGGLVNDALDELDALASNAGALASAAHAEALQAQNVNAGVAAAARDSAAQAAGHASAAMGEAAAAQKARIRAEAAEQAAWNLVNQGGGGSGDIDGGTPSSTGSDIIDGGTP